MRSLPAVGLLLTLLAAPASAAQPFVVDLANVSTGADSLVRVHGSTGDGSFGVPVAGGLDADGDGFVDFAFASMRASPVVGGTTRALAGEVYLVFGDGSGGGVLNTAIASADVLRFVGVVDSEAAGSELWMDDVTGDGLGDLLIARQNFTPSGGPIGAGALTIVVGGPELRIHAATEELVDLGDPSSPPILVTIVGASTEGRFGIWMRTGDVTGDGVADIVVGADQTSELGETHRGVVYLIRGGPHLAVEQTIDLANFGTTALPGDIVRLSPPPGSSHFHFGATCQIADLDDNGTAEVLIAAALGRAGAGIPADGGGTPHASGGAPDGTLFVAWDDNFTGTWANGFAFEVTTGPGSFTRINGASCNVRFAEEMLGGLDYDNDGAADLFVGDIVGNCGPTHRPQAGSGHVFFDAAGLKGLDFDLDSPPPGISTTDFFGGGSGDIATDTALHGDFDGDGIADLAFSSPHADPLGRSSAGILHVFFGRTGGWPPAIDLLPGALPNRTQVRIAEIYGANGTSGSDAGDTLAYSAAAGDVNGDGRTDLITNEMLGNGVLPAAEDTGNLIVISGSIVAVPAPVPILPVVGIAALVALLGSTAAIVRAAARRC